MGTNYYCKTKKNHNVRCNCGFKHTIPLILHIGKNSGGWCFRLHGISNDEYNLTNANEWEKFLQNDVREIYNEYNDPVSLEDMMKIIRKPERKLSKSEFNKLNDFVKEENSKSYYKMKIEGGLLLGENEEVLDKDGFYVVDYNTFS